MRVTVTGGAGFIGSHAVERFMRRGDVVTVIDDLSSGSASDVPDGVELIVADVGSSATTDVIVASSPDVVVHCAAQASMVRSWQDPHLDLVSNGLGTLVTVRGAMAAQARQFVYVTTGGALYGDASVLPTSESHPINPQSPYSLSKWVGERYVETLASNRIPTAVLRLANVYGPRQRPDGEGGVVSIMMDQMLAGRTPEIHGDGRQTRDFVYVGDVADAIEIAAASTMSMTVNIGTGVGTSILELCDVLTELTSYQGDRRFGPARMGDVRHSVLDPRHAAEVLGWRATTSLRQGLLATMSTHARRSAHSRA